MSNRAGKRTQRSYLTMSKPFNDALQEAKDRVEEEKQRLETLQTLDKRKEYIQSLVRADDSATVSICKNANRNGEYVIRARTGSYTYALRIINAAKEFMNNRSDPFRRVQYSNDDDSDYHIELFTYQIEQEEH